jgi:hypothetical protein
MVKLPKIFKKGLERDAFVFEAELNTIKKEKVDFTFYPYSSISNIGHLEKLLQPTEVKLTNLINRKKVLDVGAADGDMSFLSEYWGAKQVDVIDFPLFNYNGLRGIKYIKKRLKSKVIIYEYDLDSLNWPKLDQYDFCFFLGIMYHLKNPVLVLEQLSKHVKKMVISSKVFDIVEIGGKKVRMSDHNLCYFWKPAETNNDTSNWWCYTESSMKQIIERAGWRVISATRVDQYVGKAEPSNMKLDGRYFIYAESTQI